MCLDACFFCIMFYLRTPLFMSFSCTQSFSGFLLPTQFLCLDSEAIYNLTSTRLSSLHAHEHTSSFIVKTVFSLSPPTHHIRIFIVWFKISRPHALHFPRNSSKSSPFFKTQFKSHPLHSKFSL